MSPSQPSSREGERHPSSACTAREILDRVGDKWTVLSIVNLAEGSLRFNELLRRGHGVSQRMLTQTLRQLERDGIVWRKVTPTVPLTVEYGLTEMGRGLLEVLRPLFVWSEQNAKAIARARDRYDGRESEPEASR